MSLLDTFSTAENMVQALDVRYGGNQRASFRVLDGLVSFCGPAYIQTHK